MDVRFLNIVLSECILCTAVENQSFLLTLVIRKRNLDVELRFVDHFDLEAEKGLNQEKFSFARVFR